MQPCNHRTRSYLPKENGLSLLLKQAQAPKILLPLNSSVTPLTTKHVFTHILME